MGTLITVILTAFGTKLAEHLFHVFLGERKQNLEHKVTPVQPVERYEEDGIIGIRRHKMGGYSAVNHFTLQRRDDIIPIRAGIENKNIRV